jgi:quercetin dioxygenase-like cupin family protein
MPGKSPVLRGRAFVPGKLVRNQRGAIVSRVVLKKKTGNVTLFAFDQGQELSEHTAPFDALIHVLDGAARVSIAGRWMNVPAGAMIILPADVPHAVRAKRKFVMMLTMIRA